MAARDWTLKKYHELLSAIQETGYKTETIQEYLTSPSSSSIILRHDVDRFPKNALKMAKLEHNNNIKSTYYFRMTSNVFRPHIIKELSNLGHEIGYHYEVLSKESGDIGRSTKLFKEELMKLRRLAPIHTAAAHGSPLSEWNNQDIWNHLAPSDFNLVGEAYKDIDYENILYFTDTGRAWDSSTTNLRDRTQKSGGQHVHVHTTDELISLVCTKKYANMCIQTHPERWNYNTSTWIRSATLDFATNLAKRAIQIRRIRK